MPQPRPDFTHRAQPADLPEWMDEPCSYEDFKACLHSLEQCNRITFTYRPTLQWLEQFAGARKQPLHIVDVGSGGGDMLRRIEAWARRKSIAVKLTGIDLNPHAARAARESTATSSSIEWVTGNAFSYKPAVPIDLVISSLFTHHLPDAEIVLFVRWMETVAQIGWFVNDLHREPLPYYGFALLANVVRWHRFVRHDGPVSIRRAFQPADWQAYLAAADIPLNSVSIATVRPARLCVSRVR